MHGPDHDHEHEHSTLSPLELRVRALETVLTQKGYVDPAALDALIDTYQTKIGPPGTRARPIALEWSRIRAACSRTLACVCPRRCASGCGIRRLRYVTSWC